MDGLSCCQSEIVMSRRINAMLTIVPVPRSDVDEIVRLAISPTMILRTTRFEQVPRVSAGCWSLGESS